MVKAQKKSGQRPSQEVDAGEDTTNRIVSAATRLFAERGYEGTSTKEICDAAGVNIAAIHYHFDSKENLYRHIIERFMLAKLDSARQILQIPRNPDDLRVRLEIFLRDTLESCIAEPDLFIITQREMELCHARSESVFRNTMLKRIQKLIEFFAQAKKHKLIAPDVEPIFAARALMTQLIQQLRFDRVMKKYFGHSFQDEEYRDRWLKHTLRMFLGGVVEK